MILFFYNPLEAVHLPKVQGWDTSHRVLLKARSQHLLEGVRGRRIIWNRVRVILDTIPETSYTTDTIVERILVEVEMVHHHSEGPDIHSRVVVSLEIVKLRSLDPYGADFLGFEELLVRAEAKVCDFADPVFHQNVVFFQISVGNVVLVQDAESF